MSVADQNSIKYTPSAPTHQATAPRRKTPPAVAGTAPKSSHMSRHHEMTAAVIPSRSTQRPQKGPGP